MKVLILGGYGVFGGRLARLLIEDGYRVVIAGRSAEKAQAFVDVWGGEVCVMDRTASDLADRFVEQGADVVVDASGPFQAYGDADYGVAPAARAARATP